MDDTATLNLPMLDLRVLVCRWRQLEAWGGKYYYAPFWRFYWNPTPGARVICDGVTHELDAHQRVLIPPHCSFRGEHDGPFEHFFLHFILGDAYAIRDATVFAQEIRRPEQQRLARFVRHLRAAPDCPAPLALDIHAYLIACLRQLPTKHWREAVQDPRIRSALAILQANLADPPGNDRLASYVDLHPGSFVRLFTQQVGIPPHRYTLLARLDRAAHDLLHGQLPIESIARMWGFTDRQHFTRAMRKHRFITPGQLRKQSS